MQKIQNWLSKQVGWKYLLVMVLILVILNGLWAIIMRPLIYEWIPPKDNSRFIALLVMLITDPIWFFTFAILIGPLWEEFIYRFCVLTFVVTKTLSFWWIGLAVILSSIVFGLRHDGLPSIFIYGIFGVCSSIIFLKAGAYNKNYKRGFLYCFVFHSLFNIWACIRLLFL